MVRFIFFLSNKKKKRVLVPREDKKDLRIADNTSSVAFFAQATDGYGGVESRWKRKKWEDMRLASLSFLFMRASFIHPSNPELLDS